MKLMFMYNQFDYDKGIFLFLMLYHTYIYI